MGAPADVGEWVDCVAAPGEATLAKPVDCAADQANIMVVDDHIPNLKLLEEMLRRKGHRVRSFARGQDALDAARELPPDLVLLDINMPGLNGYQVCKLFKNDPSLAQIPVIFLSALIHAADKVEAFRAGGLDYISKPFEFEEVHARVETHLKLHCLQKALRDQNLCLEAIVETRTRELAAAHQRLSILDQAKSQFLRMISHELRTPLNGLLGASELVLSELEPTESGEELREIFAESRERILSIVDSALLLTQIEIDGGRFRTELLCLGDILAGAAQLASQFAEARGVRIEIPNEEIGWTTGNRDALLRAWRALIETAVKFSMKGDEVIVSHNRSVEDIVLLIDTGAGAIPAADLAGFFDLFATAESSTQAGSLGLDPAVAGRIISLFGGSLGVENLAPSGIRIRVHCPRAGLPVF